MRPAENVPTVRVSNCVVSSEARTKVQLWLAAFRANE